MSQPITLDELQIVISVQSEQVQSQINSVINSLSGLNSAVSTHTSNMASSFGGLTNIFGNAAIGAAMNKSITGAMAQATNTIRAGIANLQREMVNSVQNHSVQIEVEQKVNAEVGKINTHEMENAMHSAIVDMGIDITDSFKQITSNIKSQITSLGEYIGEKMSSISGGGENNEPLNLGGTISGVSVTPKAGSRTLGDMLGGQSINDYLDMHSEGISLGGGSGGHGEAPLSPFGSMHLDSDDDVPTLTAIHHTMENYFNRQIAQQTRENRIEQEMEGQETSMQSAFQRMIECCEGVRSEAQRIYTLLAERLTRTLGGAGAPAVVGEATSAEGGVMGAFGAMGIGAMLRRYLAALGIGMLIKSSIQEGMNSIESENLFTTSLGPMQEQARQWSLQLQNSLGLNGFELRRNIGLLYTMGNSMGLTTKQAYDMSTKMTMLANDMASFYNISTSDAFDKLRSGISGESEPLKQLGILVNDTMVKNYAYASGIAKQNTTLTEAQKVLARYNLIMTETKTASGDLERTINSPANQLRLLMTQLELIKINLGQAFMPIVQIVLPILVEFAKYLVTITGYVAAFMQALFGKSADSSNSAATANIKVADSLNKVSDAANKAKGSVTGFDEINQLNFQKAQDNSAGATGDDGAVAVPGGANSGLMDAMSNVPADVKKKMQEVADAVKDILNGFFKPFKDSWAIYGDKICDDAKGIIGDVGKAFEKAGKTLADIWTSPEMSSIVMTLTGIFTDLLTILKRIADEIILPLWNDFFDLINPKKNPATAGFLDILGGILKAVKTLLDYLSGDGFGIVKTFLEAWAAIWAVNKIFEVIDAVKKLITVMKELSLIEWLGSFAEGEGMIATFLVNLGKIGAFFSGLSATISGAFAGLGEIATTAGEAVLGGFATVGSFFAGLGEVLLAPFEALAVAIGAPVEAVITVIAGIGIAIALLITHWDDVKAVAKVCWDYIKEVAGVVWDTLKATWLTLGDVFGKLWDDVKKAAGVFWDTMQKAGEASWDGIKKAWEVIDDVFAGFWKVVKVSGATFWNDLSKLGTTAWTDVKKVWDTVEKYFSGIWNNITKTATKVWNGITTTITNVVTSVKNGFNSLVTWVTGTFTTSWGKAWKAVVSGFSTIVSGIGNVFKIPLNAVIDAIDGFFSGLNRFKFPDWVPGLGGKGVDIPLIPRLARGGIIDSPTIAQIGEAGPEAVVPLENTSFVTTMAEAIGNAVGDAVNSVFSRAANSGGSGDIIIQVDGMALGRAAADGINRLQKKTGRAVLTT